MVRGLTNISRLPMPHTDGGMCVRVLVASVSQLWDQILRPAVTPLVPYSAIGWRRRKLSMADAIGAG